MTGNEGTGSGAATPGGDTRERLARALGGEYAVRRLLGRGGFAEVFEVWDAELDRRLAVKVLRPDIAWTSGMLARFREEARAVARLNHPNILPIHFVGQGEGLVYYVMPFVEGQSLGDLLQGRGALDTEQAIALIRPILEALQHAHERGLIHRDIKPDNVLIDVTTSRPLLMDFGIAKQLGGDKGLTQTGFVVGTPHYMSPEQALGQGDLDARSDLYALGAMLFQMVTGSPPFEGETSQEIVGKHISEPPPAPSAHNTNVPQWLSAVILRCLAKTPAERFQSAAAVLDALGGAVDSGPTEVQPSGARQVVPNDSEETTVVPSGIRSGAGRAPRRRRWMLGGAAGVVLVTGAGIGAFVVSQPTLELENGLVEPIAVSVNGDEERRVEPGGRITVRLPRGRPLVANWSLVRPITPNGTPMGVEVHATVVAERPRGAIRRRAESWVGDSAYFAPLITNATDQPLSVIVNAGLRGALGCACVIAPGAVRATIGYYSLYRNSTVQVEDPQGRTASFEDLGPQVEPTSGRVGLRFETANLR